MEIRTLALILMKFCTHIPTCPRKVLGQVSQLPHPHPLGLGGLKYLEMGPDPTRPELSLLLTRSK